MSLTGSLAAYGDLYGVCQQDRRFLDPRQRLRVRQGHGRQNL